jgi:hypothetical protein
VQVLQAKKKARPLTLWPLVALIFFDVSGGPFGIEVRRTASAAPRCPRRAARAARAAAQLLQHDAAGCSRSAFAIVLRRTR